ncbi:MAG: hypothetical protein ABSB29_01120 [Nitrososphaerales archaeon]
MTLVIAAYAKDRSTVVCSDSQSTSQVHKRLDAKKIHIMGKSCILAGAGEPAYTSMLLSTVRISKDFSIANVSREMGKMFEEFGPREVVKRHNGLESSVITVLIEYSKPRIYRITDVGAFEKIRTGPRGFTSIGSGILWSNWLMRHFYSGDMERDALLELLVYVVSSVSEVSSSVGGPPRAATISPMNGGWEAEFVSNTELSKITEKVTSRGELLNSFWLKCAEDPSFEKSLYRLAEQEEEGDET